MPVAVGLSEKNSQSPEAALKPSQELQGEASEVLLEERLVSAFPQDLVEPVKKGQAGGDVLQVLISRARGAAAADVRRWIGRNGAFGPSHRRAVLEVVQLPEGDHRPRARHRG